ncbi:MAG: tRNA pseudouridine(38-40) synthase TruA [Actinomycetota bacterium]
MIIRLVLAYDGTGFRGWAKQPRVRTVEGELQKALQRMLRETPSISVAGRTDAGVHARGQVASLEAPDELDLDRLRRGLNTMLAPEIVVRSASRVPEGFDARFSANAREYRYRIDVGPVADPFTARFTWHRPGELSLGAMRAAARHLIGPHDFASFGRRSDDPGASTARILERLSVVRREDVLEVTARANAFLQQMVRSLVGTLVAVGEGKLDPAAMPAVLAARDRSGAGPVAPPHGLTLERVVYGRPRPSRRP